MHRRISILVAVLAVSIATAASGQLLTFNAILTGSNEVPPVETDTMGRSRVVFDIQGGLAAAATFRLDVFDGVRATQAHFHCAPAGTNGPIVAFLAGFHDRGWDLNGQWASATLTDANVLPTDDPACPTEINNLTDLARAAFQGNIYVNVHTIAHGGGEVRGQLTRP